VTAAIALLGAGPRAVAVAARLVADLEAVMPGGRLDVHLIDAVEVGAGRTWRTDQDRYLLCNTYAAETTVFADESIPTLGPTQTGPSLAEWLELVAREPAGFDDDVVEEARRATPWSFPTRAVQGTYFRWALDRVIASAPAGITFHEHVAQVVSLDDAVEGAGDLDSAGGIESADGRAVGGAQRITFADGSTLRVDVVVLLQGLLTSGRSAEATRIAADSARHGLIYLSPGMPSERDWDALPAGEPVIVRGLGANFFDLVGGLFEGRGGRFERGGDGLLHYTPSGREPLVIAGSRRGLPYRGKAYYDTGLPATIELPRFSAHREWQLIADHAGRADVDFSAALAADLQADFRDVFESTARASASTTRTSASTEQASSLAEEFDWRHIVFPTEGRTFRGDEQWQAFLDDYLRRELDRIRHPEASPHKAVHRAAETARRRLSRLVLAGVFDPLSVVRDLSSGLLGEYAVLASGPPPERVERFAALRRQGFIEVLGPGLEVAVTGDGFVATTAVPGQRRVAQALAEARMQLGDLRATDDPLVRHLLHTGQARYHVVTSAHGAVVETKTLDVTGDGFLLIRADGVPHPRRIVLGSTAGDVQFNAAIGAIPHTGDKMLVGAERAAVRALRTAADVAALVAS
jgi:hypothetical protein